MKYILENTLREMYLTNHMSLPKIADALDVSTRTAHRRLIKFGIPRRTISEANKGQVPWNLGIPCAKETKDKISETKRGQEPWNKGKRGLQVSWNKGLTEDDPRVRKNAESSKKTLKERYSSGELKQWNKDKLCPQISKGLTGRVLSKESREKISESLKGKFAGEDNPSWLGGVSFEPYTPEFNEILKKQIRERDGHICQECGIPQEELGYKLHVHHIDYDKRNNNPSNLIALCCSCNSKANFNREGWMEHFGNNN